MKKERFCHPCCWAGILVVFGAVNWGFYGVFHTNVVANLFGDDTIGAKIVYGLIGISGVVKTIGYFFKCPACPENKEGFSCKK